MSTRAFRQIALVVALFIATATPAHAGARATIGESWSAPSNKLQSIIDVTYGPGRINVHTDYLGARPGDPDQIVWKGSMLPIMRLREIAGSGLRRDFGWYFEADGGNPPVIDGVGDAPVFGNLNSNQATIVFQVRHLGQNVGFYLHSSDAGSGQGPRTFFTNRTFNDVGPGGKGAVHEPTAGGDIQALVFDVSTWTRPHTWLVCFESRDTGALPGACCETTDNDYADYVIEVRAEATTATLSRSFGALKLLYRD
jgi:hypothetical protein